jgi:RNA polymerase sigma factor (sigma-70 family)
MSEPQAPVEERYHDLLVRYGGALRRLAAVYFANAADREELFQEIALALWTALPRFRGDASERTWLYRVAHNVAITHKARRCRRDREAPLEDLPSNGSGARDARLDVQALIRRLPTVDCQILSLHLDGLSGSEIAEVTGLTQSNVGVRLMRARQKLAAMLHGARRDQ